jgi:hypothetical protein
MGFNQNLFFIDIFAFSDVMDKILTKIKDIIMTSKTIFRQSEDSIFLKKFEIYRDSTLEELYSIVYNSNVNLKMRMNFYEHLYTEKKNVPIFNYFKFPVADYRDKNKDDIIDKERLKYITNYIIHGNIYGYYTENEANGIYTKFNEDIEDIDYALINANLKNMSLNSLNFTEWMTKKENITKNKSIEYYCGDNILSGYTFFHWSSFNLRDLIISKVLDVIINNDYINKSNNQNYTNLILIKSNVFSQGEIYIQFEANNNIINYRDTIYHILDNYKNIYTDMVDSIGNRLYYLLKSLALNQLAKREDLKNSAIAINDIMTHKKIDYTELNQCKNYDYINDIINTTNHYLSNSFYVSFICKKGTNKELSNL